MGFPSEGRAVVLAVFPIFDCSGSNVFCEWMAYAGFVHDLAAHDVAEFLGSGCSCHRDFAAELLSQSAIYFSAGADFLPKVITFEGRMTWYLRKEEGIRTPAEAKIGAPDGLWVKCPNCQKPLHIQDLISSLYVCIYCGNHLPIGSQEYFRILFEKDQYEVLFENILPTDPLDFVDSKPYKTRLLEAQRKTNLTEAVRCAVGQIGPYRVAVAVMDFGFIGGSMGSVVGERIARLIQLAIAQRLPLLIVSRSGGARMMEGSLSLVQMAKTAAWLAEYSKTGLPYISVLTDPTMGGVTASFAMLGDINIAEPKALIGFAGPRVIREATGKDLPPGFQEAEFQLEHGFIDLIVDRRQLKSTLLRLWNMLL
jgi:acetyl-CoA carboxylase carboxyl transferase subunit beta